MDSTHITDDTIRCRKRDISDGLGGHAGTIAHFRLTSICTSHIRHALFMACTVTRCTCVHDKYFRIFQQGHGGIVAFNGLLPGTAVLEMGFDEVVLLSNDPSHLERGLIRFEVLGGRQ